MINRRDFLGFSVSAGAGLALTPDLLRGFQQQGGTLIQRSIPSSGEKLPVVGLSFSNHVSCADRTALRQVFKTFVDNGGKVYDALHGDAASEQFHATIANELGVQNTLFWTMRGLARGGPGGPPQHGAATVNTHIDTLLARTKAARIDLAMLPLTADPTCWAALKEEKRAGRVRYIGAQTIVVKHQSAQLEAMMRRERLDFIGVDYDLSNRQVEETILPLAQARQTAVIAFFPFSNNSGVSCGAVSRNLFARVGNTPVPIWAAEFDVKTWAQFFLKYVISHPAITTARVGTTKASHMIDNLAGGIGRLPDEATRKRMAAFIDALPELPPIP
jgi:aryl-alcohol dehydrogenase-like predicted oxidoreductase